MHYEWHNQKYLSNLKKHNIDFADAVTVFDDNFALTIEDKSHDETRFITIGIDAYERTLVVVYAHHRNTIRIISARRANNIERNFYRKSL